MNDGVYMESPTFIRALKPYQTSVEEWVENGENHRVVTYLVPTDKVMEAVEHGAKIRAVR